MKKVTDNVFVEDRYSAQPYNRGCNPGYVTTAEGVVMIDTPMLPRDAIKWRDRIARAGEVRYIVNTHFHADHTSGNYLFSAPIIAHDGDRDMGKKLLKGIFIPGVLKKSGGRPLTLEETARYDIEDRDPEGLALMKDFYLKPPDITFSESLTLYVGSHTFVLTHLPGHVANHIGVYVPEEKVFFAGDNFTNKVQPVMSSSLPFEWIASLKKMEAMDAEKFVPGHGKVGNKKDIREFRLFIESCLETVRDAMKKGMSQEEAAGAISFESVYPAIHPGAEQQGLNVSRLYEVLSERTA
jgi:cyclase